MKQSAGEVFAPILLVLGIIISIGVWHEWTGGAEAADYHADLQRPGAADDLAIATRRGFDSVGGRDADFPSWTGDSGHAPWVDDSSPSLAQRAYSSIGSFFSFSDPEPVHEAVYGSEDDQMVVGAELRDDDALFADALLAAGDAREYAPRWETADEWSADALWMDGAPSAEGIAELGPRRAPAAFRRDWR